MVITFCNIIVAFYCMYLCMQIKHYANYDFRHCEFYKLPSIVGVGICAHAIGLLTVWNNFYYFLYVLDLLEGSLEHGGWLPWSILISAFLIIVFACIFFIYIAAFFVENTSCPLHILLNNYKQTKSNSCISYSVFKSMYQMHQEYFTLTRTTFAYHDLRFHLSFIDYIRACCLINANEKSHRANNTNKIYQQMQQDLQKDRTELQLKNEAALQQMQEIINRSQN